MRLALAVFCVVTAPVNAALTGRTAATLPFDWPEYRLRWEAGHATSFVLVLCAFVAQLCAWFADHGAAARRRDSLERPAASVDEA
jgi:hypothetical protein